MAIFEKRRSKAVALAIAMVALAAVVVAGQVRSVENRTLPRTPWGDPDLQGVWSIATITPFERPSALAGKQVLTEARSG